mmetsp:Transcript_12348/g.22313  ORF Transcript_12348/g.22313 Transcript_12348/m.22313 type:complete len:88 (+) Transcript_12348:626-889(+)
MGIRCRCKGKVLDEILMTFERRPKVVYVGDGFNDLCPSLRLKKNELICARQGFSLARHLKSGNYVVDARVILWNSGYDVLSHIQEIL